MELKPPNEQLYVRRDRPAALTEFTCYNNSLTAGAKRYANLRKIIKKKDALWVDVLT